ncbi:CoA transferase [Lapillicoccus sp.]|uniref:CoA transferase n=1 Tax=Lapillicoccus sp. TaxID=1909287 RepID=UPI0025F8BDAA|nr:CoA transferase [Lapillicoccus sp.]
MTNPVLTSLMAAVGDEGPAASVSPGTTGLDSRSRSEDLAVGSVGFCATEAWRWLGTDLTVDPGRVGANFRSLGHLRLDGAAFPSFAPLSGFFEARDGWVRTHADYDWHRARLAAVLGLDADERRPPTKENAAAAIRSWRAHELEDAVTAAGGIAARVRTAAEFGAVVGPAPLLTVERGVTRAVPSRRIRVLDLTRVIAGPVTTRTLAALGMDVLRIDPPQLPEMPGAYLDSAAGKRSVTVDLAGEPELTRRLVEEADVIVTGYRPGALDHLGLGADDLHCRRPDAVVATIQAACGIADLEAGAGGIPGALSAQALDHSCGYLLAGAILHALACGRGARITTSLTGAGLALLALGPTTSLALAADDAVHLETVETPAGRLTRVRSMWEVDGVSSAVTACGSSAAVWADEG